MFTTSSGKTSWIFCLVAMVVYSVVYTFVNHLPLNRKILPFILGEEKIPFLPWTLIIYLSSFLQAILVMRCTPWEILRKTLPAFGILLIVSFLVFVLFPVRFPRELYPSHSMLVNYFQSVDKDGNCFPSLHVIIPIMFSGIYSWIAISRMRICMIWAWTVLIVVSVFTTKQHYVVDVFAAVVMVVPVMFYLKRKVLREVKMIPTLRP